MKDVRLTATVDGVSYTLTGVTVAVRGLSLNHGSENVSSVASIKSLKEDVEEVILLAGFFETALPMLEASLSENVANLVNELRGVEDARS
jgi:hypothetical protein